MIYFDKETDEKFYSNSKFDVLEGYIENSIAKSTLAEFLYQNLGIACELILGIKLFPFQEIILRGWFDHNFSCWVAARGASKSWLCAVFCCLYPIFYPETRIVLSANAMRSTRRTILQIERFINSKGAGLLRQCFTARTGKIEFQRRSDEMTMEINNGFIIALPLNEKIRGTRGDVLFVDEFLLVPEELYKNVLLPFLTAKSNIQERMRMKEDIALFDQAKLTEEEKGVLENDKKIIALTSASYDFEFAYRLYCQWVEKIEGKAITGRKYFVARMSYECLPEELIEKEIVEEAKSGGAESASFQREFMARFASTSDGYFNIKKLHDNTIKPGDLPCVQLKGIKDIKYILAIDPSFSASSSSDFFSYSIFALNDVDRSITQVHSYAVAGGDLKDHIKYFYYLLSSFNIVFIIADLGGANFNFLETANESAFFTERGVKLALIDGALDAEDYLEQLKIARNSYNTLIKKICYRQIFTSEWLRKSNEFLQAQIDKNKVKFASPLSGHEEMMQKALDDEYPIIFSDKGNQDKQILDFIADQDYYIEETKKELALIECKVTPLGTAQYDLPQHMRRSKNKDRARRDLYTCTLMATWGAKLYWDIMYTEVKKKISLCIPTVVK